MKLQKRGDEEMPENPEEKKAETPPVPKKKSQESVFVYMALLFTVAFILILLSYFVQERRNSDTINSLTEQHGKFTVQAMENIETLQNKNLELQDENESLKEENDALTEENDALTEENENLENKVERLKEEWEAAKEAVETTEKAKTEEVEMKKQAMEQLLLLYMAKQDKGDVEKALSEMEPYAKYLDGAYSELYESLKK